MARSEWQDSHEGGAPRVLRPEGKATSWFEAWHVATASTACCLRTATGRTLYLVFYNLEHTYRWVGYHLVSRYEVRLEMLPTVLGAYAAIHGFMTSCHHRVAHTIMTLREGCLHGLKVIVCITRHGATVSLKILTSIGPLQSGHSPQNTFVGHHHPLETPSGSVIRSYS